MSLKKDKEFKEFVLKTLLRILDGRLEDLENVRKYNGRMDKEILDTKNDITRYKRILEELNKDET